MPGPAGLTFADVPNRIIAFILDVIVLSVIGLLLALVVGGAFGGLASGGRRPAARSTTRAASSTSAPSSSSASPQLAISFAYFA